MMCALYYDQIVFALFAAICLRIERAIWDTVGRRRNETVHGAGLAEDKSIRIKYLFLIFANYENHFILQASSEFRLISGSFS